MDRQEWSVCIRCNNKAGAVTTQAKMAARCNEVICEITLTRWRACFFSTVVRFVFGVNNSGRCLNLNPKRSNIPNLSCSGFTKTYNYTVRNHY